MNKHEEKNIMIIIFLFINLINFLIIKIYINIKLFEISLLLCHNQ